MVVTFTDGTTSGVVAIDVTPQLSKKIIQVRVPATFVWGTDAIAVDLMKYGASKISGFLAFEETTAGSITVQATGTTAVVTTLTAWPATSVLTYTSTGSAVNTCGGTLIVFAY
jgi:hypothetical protein